MTAVLALALTSCHDDPGPVAPAVRGLFTTPTGLVTSNPPQILVGAGDIASCANDNDEATAQLLDNIAGTVMAIGDNAYDNGSAKDYKNCYDPTWGRHKARTQPAAGNHEYNSSGATPYFNYYGAAAGTPGQGWYSYDLGAWHIIVLNSNISTGAGSAQDIWLKADLAAHSNLCTLAYFHHPLYSSTGGSGSGGITYSGVRQFWDDLYPGGVDVVLGGHRHFYERMAPMTPSGSRDDASGIREIIAGTGGMSGGDQTNVFPLSEARNGNTFGVLKLYLYDDSYAWKFVPVAGRTFTDSGSTACHGAPGSGDAGSVSPANSTISASPSAITAAGGSSTITVTVKDGSGNPVSGATVALAATGSGNTLIQPTSTTNSNGVATGSLSSSVAEVKTISATANGVAVTQTAAVTVTAGSVSASQSSVTAAPATIAVGGGASTITVTVKDSSGNPVSGATVVLATTGSGNTLVQPTGTTSAGGVATGSLSSTVAETKSISATANGVALAQSATVTVTNGAVSASLSTVTASPATLTASSGSATITVTVKDGSGNPVSGATVILAATGSGNTLTQPAGTTNSSGVATGTLSSWAAEIKTVSAIASGVAITQTAPVTVTAGAASASQSTVTASPTSFTASSGASTITVTVKDGSGNPVNGATVVLAATGSGNTLMQPSGTTNSSGVTTGTLTSSVAETKTVSATADGVGITQSASVTVTAAGGGGGGGGGTISHTLLTSGHDPANQQVYTTASIAPAPNSLVTIAVLTHQASAAAPSPTLSGGGMTSWDVVASVAYNGSTPLDRLTIYRAMSSAPGSGPITINSSVTVSNCQWIVSQWSGVDGSGTNGSGAIVQAVGASGTAVTSLTAALAAFASARDVAYGAFGVASATAVVTAGSGFTTIDQQPSGESTVGDLLAEWALNQPSVTATWTSKNAGALGLEIKAAP